MELFDINKILPALLGGGILGTAAGLRYLCNGRILGISGIYGGLLRGEQGTSWRFTFTAGMLLGGLILRNSMPSAFYPISGDFPLSRLIGGGLLVGTGASLGRCAKGLTWAWDRTEKAHELYRIRWYPWWNDLSTKLLSS